MGGHLAHRHPLGAQPIPVSGRASCTGGRAGQGAGTDADESGKQQGSGELQGRSTVDRSQWRGPRMNCDCGIGSPLACHKCACPSMAGSHPCPRMQQAALPPCAGAAPPAAHEPGGPAHPHRRGAGRRAVRRPRGLHRPALPTALGPAWGASCGDPAGAGAASRHGLGAAWGCLPSPVLTLCCTQSR